MKKVFAIAAHPDDIEFMMAGTMILLKEAGCELHYMNIANGSCGTTEYDVTEIVRIRTEEAREAAALIGATFYPPLVNDAEILYEMPNLYKLTAIIRKVEPDILLLPSPEDYMEDHTNTSSLGVTAAFCRGMRNFPTIPLQPPVQKNVTVYHALPYGLRDGLGKLVRSGQFVNISTSMALKKQMLAMHKSQKEWLDKSQGLDAYLETMRDMCADVGKMSGRFDYAEGWRKHLHLGFCEKDDDPLTEILGENVFIDPAYQERLGEI